MSAFTLIGERLNTHRENIRAAVAKRDVAAVVKEIQSQQACGVTHLDFNASASAEQEADELLWMLSTALPVLNADVGVAIDSASPGCIAKALFQLKGRPHTIVNLAGGAIERWQAALPQIKQHGAGVIGLLSAGETAPKSMAERIKVAEQLHSAFSASGIPEEQQYFDPQILPLAYDAAQPKEILETVRELRRRWPRAHVIAGLSNISFTLPARSEMHRAFLAMLLACGMDGIICNPCDRALQKTLLAARALLGQDDFLANYLSKITE